MGVQPGQQLARRQVSARWQRFFRGHGVIGVNQAGKEHSEPEHFFVRRVTREILQKRKLEIREIIKKGVFCRLIFCRADQCGLFPGPADASAFSNPDFCQLWLDIRIGAQNTVVCRCYNCYLAV